MEQCIAELVKVYDTFDKKSIVKGISAKRGYNKLEPCSEIFYGEQFGWVPQVRYW